MATAAICFSLVGWHVAESAQYVETEPAKVSDDVLVRGRLISFLGPPEIDYYVAADSRVMEAPLRRVPPPKDEQATDRKHWRRRAKRSWFCIYNVDTAVETPSDDYPFTAGRYTIGLSIEVPTKIEMPVVGQMIVEPR